MFWCLESHHFGIETQDGTFEYVERLAWNRTILELKLQGCDIKPDYTKAWNRTILELKPTGTKKN